VATAQAGIRTPDLSLPKDGGAIRRCFRLHSGRRWDSCAASSLGARRRAGRGHLQVGAQSKSMCIAAEPPPPRACRGGSPWSEPYRGSGGGGFGVMESLYSARKFPMVRSWNQTKGARMTIWKNIHAAALPFAMLMAAGSAQAQSVAYSPGAGYDKLSWSAFVTVVAPVPAPNPRGTLTFETWATDAETFTANPVRPTAEVAANPVRATGEVAAKQGSRFQRSLLSLAHVPAGLAARAEANGVAGGVPVPCGPPGNPTSGKFPTPFAALPPTNCVAEEVRRNRSSFDYITQNDLNTRSGLAKAFAQTAPIAFPNDAIEVKIDWVPVPTLVAWLSANGVNVTPAFVAQNYFITEDADDTQYAMTSMHISTKELPDWLWATFEHQMNPGRCDTMGCYDQYGVLPPLTGIAPGAANSQYPACPKSPQLAAIFKSAHLSDVWQNYCLKATQIDFVSTQSASKGQPVLDGDSVIERITANVPIAQSSCITCHAYATFNKDGAVCQQNTGLGSPSPIGLVNPQAGQKTYDFVWGLIAVAGIVVNCSTP
jgi:hypothetical protein